MLQLPSKRIQLHMHYPGFGKKIKNDAFGLHLD